MRRIVLLVLALLMGTMSACTFNVTRNEDDSWQITMTMSEMELQEEIARALAEDDAKLSDLQADLTPEFISVVAKSTSDTGRVDQVTFKIQMGVVDGHLGVTIYNALLNDMPMNETRVAQWNQRLAERLENGSKRHPNSTLLSVSMTETDLMMEWRAVRND